MRLSSVEVGQKFGSEAKLVGDGAVVARHELELLGAAAHKLGLLSVFVHVVIVDRFLGGFVCCCCCCW